MPKHNHVSKAFLKILKSVEEELSFLDVKKDADEFRTKLRKSSRVAKHKNWDLV